MTPSYRIAGLDKDRKTKRGLKDSSFKTASDQLSFEEGSNQRIEDIIQNETFLKKVKKMETMLTRKKVFLNPSRMVMLNYRLFEPKADSKAIRMPYYFPNIKPAFEQPPSVSGLSKLVDDLVRSMAQLRNPVSEESKTNIEVIADLIRNTKNTHNLNNFLLLKRTSFSNPAPSPSLDDRKDDMKLQRILQDNGRDVARIGGPLDTREV